MRITEHNGHEERTLLERVLQLEGHFRRGLEPIRVTPLQAGVILFVQRHADARVTDVAAAFCLRLPTLSEAVKTLVRKRWITKRRSVTDTRVVQLSLSRQGQVLARKIEVQVRQMSTGVTEKEDDLAVKLMA